MFPDAQRLGKNGRALQNCVGCSWGGRCRRGLCSRARNGPRIGRRGRSRAYAIAIAGPIGASAEDVGIDDAKHHLARSDPDISCSRCCGLTCVVSAISSRWRLKLRRWYWWWRWAVADRPFPVENASRLAWCNTLAVLTQRQGRESNTISGRRTPTVTTWGVMWCGVCPGFSIAHTENNMNEPPNYYRCGSRGRDFLVVY